MIIKQTCIKIESMDMIKFLICQYDLMIYQIKSLMMLNN